VVYRDCMAHTRSRSSAAIGLLLVTFGLWGIGLLAAAPAQAATLDEVAASLRADPVYNEPTAEEALTAAQAEQLRAQIAGDTAPVFIAVLPASFSAPYGGTADGVLRALRSAVGHSGVYAVVVGKSFRAGATNGTVSDLADQAFTTSSPDVFGVLTTFVTLVQGRFGSGGGSAGTALGGARSFPWIPVGLMAVVVAGGGFLVYRGVQSSRRVAARQLAEVKQTVNEDITEFGERLGNFNSADPRMTDASRTDLTAALDAYERASAASDAMSNAHSVGEVTRAIEDGRYSLACVQARLDGQEPPARRPPCFLDPRHGPSAQDMMWAPTGGVPRAIPVCVACAATLSAGLRSSPSHRRSLIPG